MKKTLIILLSLLSVFISSCQTAEEPKTKGDIFEANDMYVPWWAED